MNKIDKARLESMVTSPDTVELLASLFEESKVSKIRHVKEKARPISAAKKKSTAVRPIKGVQQRKPINRRGRQRWISGSEIGAKATKKKTQIMVKRTPITKGNPIPRETTVPGIVAAKESGIKVRAQEKSHKIVAVKRLVPAIRKDPDKKKPESHFVKRERPAVSETFCPPVASSHPQRRSLLNSKTLSIGFLFVMGILLTVLGTHFVPFDYFDNDQGIALAKNEVVENPSPKKQDIAISTASAERVETAKQENDEKPPEPPPIEREKGTIEGSAPKDLDIPLSETPQETIITAKQEIPSSDPKPYVKQEDSSKNHESYVKQEDSSEYHESSVKQQEDSSEYHESSGSTRTGEAAKAQMFQRDENKSYPYSVYLGSYKNMHSAQEAISIFQKKGLSPYWVRVDLGEKGIWYRILAGYFRTKDEVNAFIEKNQITEGRSRYVLYANLIGLYSSDEELKEKSLSLVELGYSPYVVEGDDGESLLLTGAFYYKADAEKEHIELTSKGIQSQLIKR